MNLADIENLILNTGWYNIYGTNIFNAKADIFLNFKHSPWINEDEEELSPNMTKFTSLLKENLDVIEIAKSKFSFQYKDYRIQDIELYRFTGNLSTRSGTYEIYFSRPDSFKDDQEITDPYIITLMKYLNTPRVKGFLDHAYGFDVI